MELLFFVNGSPFTNVCSQDLKVRNISAHDGLRPSDWKLRYLLRTTARVKVVDVGGFLILVHKELVLHIVQPVLNEHRP